MRKSVRLHDEDADSAGEATPLLEAATTTASITTETEHASGALWTKLRAVTFLGFSRRRRPLCFKSSFGDNDVRKSKRFPLRDLLQPHQVFEPVDALAPLVSGGLIVTTTNTPTGYRTASHPPSTVKSLPSYAPFRRKARHRSFTLWWINEFRHWWKSSRLLVRLAGLWTLAVTVEFLAKMQAIEPYIHKKHAHKTVAANAKNVNKALKIVKKLGRGGELRWFLKTVKPFTRALRILVGIWRWIEAAQCRRLEVGVEEAMVR